MKFKTYKPRVERIKAIQFTAVNVSHVSTLLTSIGYKNELRYISGKIIMFISSLDVFVHDSDWIIDRKTSLEIYSDAEFRKLYEEDIYKYEKTN